MPSDSKISDPEVAKQYKMTHFIHAEALNRLEKGHLIERRVYSDSYFVKCCIEVLSEIYIVDESLEGMPVARLQFA